MSFESDLKSHLGSDSTIGGLIQDRLFPVRLPESTTKPALVFTLVGSRPQLDLDDNDGSLLEVRVQVDCWAPSHADVIALAEAARLRMQSATLTANNFRLGDAFRQDGYDPEAKLYRSTLDFNCWYRTS